MKRLTFSYDNSYTSVTVMRVHMKQCPKCIKMHDKPGIYCCQSCANSKKWTQADKDLKSRSASAYIATLSDDERKSMTASATSAIIEKSAAALAYGEFDTLSVSHKRERILLEQNNICNLCPQTLEWNNKPLKFQLDHISGNRKDETRINLQMVCPNCHSQTETYCGKNGTKVTNKEIEDAFATSENNYHVCAKVGLNPSSHSYKRINRLRENSPVSVSGRLTLL